MNKASKISDEAVQQQEAKQPALQWRKCIYRTFYQAEVNYELRRGRELILVACMTEGGWYFYRPANRLPYINTATKPAPHLDAVKAQAMAWAREHNA